MKRHPELVFNPVDVTRSQICAAAKEFIGMEYSANTNVATRDESGKWRGSCNCYGVLLLAARECGLIDADFDLGLPPALWGQRQAKTLWEIIHANCEEVEPDVMMAGDVLLFRYRDANPTLKEPHHVGMIISDFPPMLLHAGQAAGRVYTCNIDELFLQRIESVWSLKNYVD